MLLVTRMVLTLFAILPELILKLDLSFQPPQRSISLHETLFRFRACICECIYPEKRNAAARVDSFFMHLVADLMELEAREMGTSEFEK
jgi:hypothetical protein